MAAAIAEVAAVTASPARARLGSRLWGGIVAFVGVITVTALFAGFGGQVLFILGPRVVGAALTQAVPPLRDAARARESRRMFSTTSALSPAR